MGLIMGLQLSCDMLGYMILVMRYLDNIAPNLGAHLGIGTEDDREKAIGFKFRLRAPLFTHIFPDAG